MGARHSSEVGEIENFRCINFLSRESGTFYVKGGQFGCNPRQARHAYVLEQFSCTDKAGSDPNLGNLNPFRKKPTIQNNIYGVVSTENSHLLCFLEDPLQESVQRLLGTKKLSTRHSSRDRKDI
uniref:Uncharacterized protein n=1 Tax=Triticum urartu TaxID=4572 RepID=A0A8R7TIM6_TRIUA